MKRISIILVIVVLGAIALYNSVYFEKLDAWKQKEIVKNFNPKEQVNYFWKNKLDEVLKAAIDLSAFDSLVTANPKLLKEKYGKSVGITSSFSCLVRGVSKVSKAGEDKIYVEFKGNAIYNLLVKFIFSNTARDASGYFKVSEFDNSVDFNAVSSELNALILKNVVANKLDSLTSGVFVEFYGAVEVNSEAISKEYDVIPLKIEIKQ